jgi:hypothetical protein
MENKAAKKRKFNVVDLIFILFIVAIIAVVAVKLLTDAKNKAESVEYTFVLHSDDIPETALIGFKTGDGVLDETGKKFGKITDIRTGEATVHNVDANGLDVVGPKEGYVSIDITVSAKAKPGDNFLTVAGIKYYNNSSFTFICGTSKLWLRILEMTPVSLPEQTEK